MIKGLKKTKLSILLSVCAFSVAACTTGSYTPRPTPIVNPIEQQKQEMYQAAETWGMSIPAVESLQKAYNLDYAEMIPLIIQSKGNMSLLEMTVMNAAPDELVASIF